MSLLLFSTTKDWDSRVVRLLTWSDFSHVDLIDGDEVIGAVPGQGVVVAPIHTRITAASAILVAQVEAPDDRVTALVRSQIGKPYNWAAVFGIALHRDWTNKDSWFCSELLAWAFREVEHPVINPMIYLNRVTPQMLLESIAIRPKV
jgi:uncharacterized protein YycO